MSMPSRFKCCLAKRAHLIGHCGTGKRKICEGEALQLMMMAQSDEARSLAKEAMEDAKKLLMSAKI